MPIDIETFETTPGDKLDRPTNGERVLEFLIHYSAHAFTPSEIAEGAGIKQGSIGTVLKRLEDRELVRHKGPYWAAPEESVLREARRFERLLQELDDEYGPEDRAEWRAHAARTGRE